MLDGKADKVYQKAIPEKVQPTVQVKGAQYFRIISV